MDLADPQSLGFDPERLTRLDRFIAEKYLEPGLLPHAQLLVARDGIPVHFSTQGVARTDGAPLREDAIFRIASMTKPVTSIALMMLMEGGRVALDTPVADVIPEFAGLRVYEGGGGGSLFVTKDVERPMLMLDLLRHTSV
jgi:CubicO group peptidase (beta-lactamase class C family)